MRLVIDWQRTLNTQPLKMEGCVLFAKVDPDFEAGYVNSGVRILALNRADFGYFFNL